MKITIVAMVAWGAAFVAAGAMALTLTWTPSPLVASLSAGFVNEVVPKGERIPMERSQGTAVGAELERTMVMPALMIVARAERRPLLLPPLALSPPLAFAEQPVDLTCWGWHEATPGEFRKQVLPCG